jgi:hypothetical protein
LGFPLRNKNLLHALAKIANAQHSLIVDAIPIKDANVERMLNVNRNVAVE